MKCCSASSLLVRYSLKHSNPVACLIGYVNRIDWYFSAVRNLLCFYIESTCLTTFQIGDRRVNSYCPLFMGIGCRSPVKVSECKLGRSVKSFFHSSWLALQREKKKVKGEKLKEKSNIYYLNSVMLPITIWCLLYKSIQWKNLLFPTPLYPQTFKI